ncbi:adenosylcobalamin-dependent ribonucleoside-diphosphate reductase [uncultured Arcobacter sp.]|uniref:adenosylcobalamin-dependent ribonucleoside-diphosphate reductase n=1 Tax=uncultured Arcobacter sp. TaxID=165434 RepID=UPI00263319BD|nr:adenosylcobalamin-dependent ribonucleoside-diphosphate reductase [uncultured Arcobacter sp.]
MLEQNISKEIFDKKYQFKEHRGNDYYKETEAGFYQRLGNGVDVDGIEQTLANHESAFGGRIMYALGTGKGFTTLSNCFTISIKADSMQSIMDCVSEGALILKAGGGIGMSFSILRPTDAILTTTGGKSSGAVSFMYIFDAMCGTIISGGSRRGAMMATLSIYHPDILRFIECKRDGSLKNFNLSILASDEFMDAVDNDKDWEFIFPDVTCPEYKEQWVFGKLGGNIKEWRDRGLPIKSYGTMKAREIFDKISLSNYNYAEPALIFIDTVNEMNTLAYTGEWIDTTNPCGEQPLYPYGSCNLGSINLSKFVKNPFSDDSYIDYIEMSKVIEMMVEGLDNILDKNWYPLSEQYEETKNKRQIGLGITGLGDMLAKMKLRYSSQEARNLVEGVMFNMVNIAYQKSSKIARDKGSFELFDVDEFLNNGFVQSGVLLDETIEMIKENGLRNSRVLSIAPTGTMSLFLNNCSSGIEPIFGLEFERKIRQDNGEFIPEKVKNYAWKEYTDMFGETNEVPDYFETAHEINPLDHVKMQAICQKYVDTAISKTINCPENISIGAFKDIYMTAWMSGLKGVTCYRDKCSLSPILSIDGDKPEQSKPEEGVLTHIPVEKELFDLEDAKRHIVIWKGIKVYINVVLDEEGYPLEIFSQLPYEAGFLDMNSDEWRQDIFMERMSYWHTICRLISLCLRYSIDLEEVMKQLKKSSYAMFHLGNILHRVLKQYPIIDESDDSEEEKEETVYEICPSCGKQAYSKQGGCDICYECGHSKCS